MAEKKIEKTVEIGLSVDQIEALKASLKADILKEMAEAKAKEEPMDAMADLKLAEDEKNMKVRLLAQPKKAIFIPDDGNNTPYPIVWQGVICSVKKGELVEVPLSIAEIWEESYAATRKANAKIKISEIPSLTISE